MNTYIVLIFIALVILFIFTSMLKNRGITQVSAEKAKKLVNDPAVRIIDVRTPQEFAQGHIKGAKIMPVSELKKRINEISDLKDKPVLVYCYSGSRSASACSILAGKGFKKVHNLKGGIKAWNSVN
jgi:rhodanese-related sulfurtransferase